VLITDKFVYVHAPKTGGTFVTEVLLRIYGARIYGETCRTPLRCLEYRILGKNVYRHHAYGTLIDRFEKHSPASDIPLKYSDRAIVATARDPLDLLVSEYEFKWWKRREYIRYYRTTPIWNSIASSFPRISFSDFTTLLCQAFLPPAWLEASLGYALYSFVRYYCPDSKRLISTLPTLKSYDDRLLRIKESVKDFKFISASRLNLELHKILQEFSYSPTDLQFILEKQRVHPLRRGRSAAQTCDKYFSDDLRSKTLDQERLLVDLLPMVCATDIL